MKRIARVFTLLLCLLPLVLNSFVYAADTPFILEEVSPAEQQKFIQRLKWEIFDSDEKSETISYFAINDDGKIALACIGGRTDIIKIIAPDGSFLSEYIFSWDGEYYIDWNGENLLIYGERDNYVLTVAPSGEIVACEKYRNDPEVRDFFNSLEQKGKYDAEGNFYFLRHKGFLLQINNDTTHFDHLVKRTKDGMQIIVYDDSDGIEQRLWPDVLAISISCIVVVVILIVAWYKKITDP